MKKLMIIHLISVYIEKILFNILLEIMSYVPIFIVKIKKNLVNYKFLKVLFKLSINTLRE